VHFSDSLQEAEREEEERRKIKKKEGRRPKQAGPGRSNISTYRNKDFGMSKGVKRSEDKV
jgi:hypothetical protein